MTKYFEEIAIGDRMERTIAITREMVANFTRGTEMADGAGKESGRPIFVRLKILDVAAGVFLGNSAFLLRFGCSSTSSLSQQATNCSDR